MTDRGKLWWQPWLIVGLLIAGIVFGGVVLHRSTGLKRPQGDLRVYCRAGWAIRHAPTALYRVRDDNGWHYHYPPLFAILMTPFADPPRRDLALATAAALGVGSTPFVPAPLLTSSMLAAEPASGGPATTRSIPLPIAVVVFYLVNLFLLAGAVHLVVVTIESWTAPGDRARWWKWRLVPVLVCLAPIGLTLVRSQVQILLLALLVGFVTGLVRGRRLTAGLCLAGAISLKIFPAYLLMVPLGRRDGRCLAGCVLGLIVGLGLIPVAVIGPEATRQIYMDRFAFLTSVFTARQAERPGAAEMLEATGSQSQSFQVVLHKTLYLFDNDMPAMPEPWVRMVHWLVAGGLTLALLLPGRLREEEGQALVQRLGLLILLMIVICPICHLHYLTLALPLVASLITDRDGDRWLTLLCVGFVVATSLPMVPGLGILRNVGVPLGAMLALGGYQWRCAYRGMIRSAAESVQTNWPIPAQVACSAV